MSDLIIIKNKGEIIYKNMTDKPMTLSLTLDGAKALQGLRCVCGARTDGLSGWVGKVLKLRIYCKECERDFYIEREIVRQDTEKYWHQHDCQIQIEREFLNTYYSSQIDFKNTNAVPIEDTRKESLEMQPRQGGKTAKILEFNRNQAKLNNTEDNILTKKAIELIRNKDDESI